MYPQSSAKFNVALVGHCYACSSYPVTQILLGRSYRRPSYSPHSSRQRGKVRPLSLVFNSRSIKSKIRPSSPYNSSSLCPSELRNCRFSYAHNRDWTGQVRSLSVQPRIAILGGGISGLVTAHYLVRDIPHAKVVIYEKAGRLGGWLQSEYVDVGNGRVVLESGPRTLRFGLSESLATAEIVCASSVYSLDARANRTKIQELGLEDKIVFNPHDSISARNRFVYYPDHLVRMPGPGENLIVQALRFFTEPIFKGALSVLLEFSRPPRPEDLEDESVASFFSRRLGGLDLVNNLHSAVTHGIYAGDIHKLSARSLLPLFWYIEKHFGSLMKGALNCSKKNLLILTSSQVALRRDVLPTINDVLTTKLKGASVYSFQQGLGTLSKALEKKLRLRPNVEIRLNEKAESIESTNDEIKVKSSKNKHPESFTHIVSTLLPHLSSALTPHLPSLALVPTVTVMVVNLYYRSTSVLPVHGFGYLIPRTVPLEQNPERALGVVFDSDAITGQDTAPGTKLTVMLGGHWWDCYPAYPDEEEGAMMAKAIVKRHLAINDKPEVVRVSLQRECIPQYTVGHQRRLKAARDNMSAFKGRLSVTGNGYRGVGVNDSISAARNLVKRIKYGDDDKSGLEWINEDYQIYFEGRDRL